MDKKTLHISKQQQVQGQKTCYEDKPKYPVIVPISSPQKRENTHVVLSIWIQIHSDQDVGLVPSLRIKKCKRVGSVGEQTAKYSLCAHVRAKRQACADSAL